MKKYTTAERLRQVMSQRGLKQIDILLLAEPYCIKYNVKLNKNDLSQYVNGKVEPKQHKLSILGLALNVNEAWLMGYDVPMGREPYEEKSAPAENSESEKIKKIAEKVEVFSAATDNEIRMLTLFRQLTLTQQGELIGRAELLTEQNEEIYKQEDIG
ncbi:MAG: transcriptional regulator [Ruminococcus sp.]|nr:transcriptional regulator [Candidatus Saccharibacteria bacterium]MBR6968492.1 transcriptional regulator [Ruminococcus sp.]